MILNTLNTIARRNVIRQLLIVTVIVLIGSAFAVASGDVYPVPPPDIFADAGAAVLPSADDNDHDKAITAECKDWSTAGSYFFYYSGQVTLFECMWAQVTVSHGDCNLYIYHDDSWSSAVIPPNQAGQLICSSTNGGTSTDACNGCNYACYYSVDAIWRAYMVAMATPASCCISAGMEYCEFVDVSKVASQRRGTEVEVIWEVTDEVNTAGYNVYRQIDPDEQWVRLNNALIPPAQGGHYRLMDSVPELTGDIRYRLEHVTLDGQTTLLAKVTDGDPTPPLPPGLGD